MQAEKQDAGQQHSPRCRQSRTQVLPDQMAKARCLGHGLAHLPRQGLGAGAPAVAHQGQQGIAQAGDALFEPAGHVAPVPDRAVAPQRQGSGKRAGGDGQPSR
ncbi:hypothetical protein [Paenirhodobacter sp.]|uniref:hypothetical protein n=1 Tax=Paenirhodobacter sp. TaxID=1965326 RepID=UPI003B3CD900